MTTPVGIRMDDTVGSWIVSFSCGREIHGNGEKCAWRKLR